MACGHLARPNTIALDMFCLVPSEPSPSMSCGSERMNKRTLHFGLGLLRLAEQVEAVGR